MMLKTLVISQENSRNELEDHGVYYTVSKIIGHTLQHPTD